MPLNIDSIKIHNISIKTSLDLLRHNSSQYGFHPLFYFQRARGKMFIVEDTNAALICSYRHDVKKFIIIRPAGNAIDIVETIKKLYPMFMEEFGTFYVRYANEELKLLLSNEFDTSFDFKWNENSLYDDETYPQVRYVLADMKNVNASKRNSYRWIRQCMKMHGSSAIHKTLAYPQIELEKLKEFSKENIPKSIRNKVSNLSEFYDFIDSTFDGITKYSENIDFHLFEDGLGSILGVLISSQKDVFVDVYFFSHQDMPKLSTFILMKVMQHYENKGADYFNVGGSETKSLHLFKEQLLPTSEKIETFFINIF